MNPFTFQLISVNPFPFQFLVRVALVISLFHFVLSSWWEHKKRQVACMFLFFTLCRNVQLVCSHFHHWFVYDILNILFLILTLNATLARERECCCPYIKAK